MLFTRNTKEILFLTFQRNRDISTFKIPGLDRA